jgi:hypothetical protein
MAAGAVLSSLDERCPYQTACSSFIVANICILLLVLDIKHSDVSKTVWMMSVSITELIFACKILSWNQNRKSEIWACMYSPESPMKFPWDMNDVALPRGSTRCQPSIEIITRLLCCCGSEWEQNISDVHQAAILWSRFFLMVVTCSRRQEGILRLEHYWRYMLTS